jgi:hypothetical protein
MDVRAVWGATKVVGAAWGMADVVDATLGTTKVVGATRCATEVSEAANEGATRGRAVYQPEVMVGPPASIPEAVRPPGLMV